MKKFLLSLAALPVATFTTAASAQPNYQPYGHAQTNAEFRMENRIAGLEARLEAGVQAGAIDRREARDLRRQLSDLRRMEMTYSQNGLTRDERMQLQQRIRTLRDQLRMAGNDNGWSNRYGWNDTDFDAYGSGYGNTGYGSTRPNSVTYDRYGNPIPGSTYDGRGGPYETVPGTRSGGFRIGDVISNLLGGGSLNRVPSTYSSQYRDRSDVYFRSDGRQVYEIDARTNRVIRVHPMQ